MDQDLKQEAFESKHNSCKADFVYDKKDAQTLEKRQQVREKLKKSMKTTQDVDELLSSIEHYCFIILKSLK